MRLGLQALLAALEAQTDQSVTLPPARERTAPPALHLRR
jgi:hypothetical protein